MFLSPISLQKTPSTKVETIQQQFIQVAFANVGCDEQGDTWTDAIAFLHEFLGFFLAHKSWQEKKQNRREKPLIFKVKWRHGGRKSHFLQRIFVGLPEAFPDLNFRKVHVSQVETPRGHGLSFNPNLPSWSKHIQQDHHDASEEELHDDKDGASATFSRTTPGKLVKPIEHLLKKCSANLHPNCQAPSAKFPTHLSPLFTVLFFFQQHHHGAISFSYGDLLLANPWPCW